MLMTALTMMPEIWCPSKAERSPSTRRSSKKSHFYLSWWWTCCYTLCHICYTLHQHLSLSPFKLPACRARLRLHSLDLHFQLKLGKNEMHKSEPVTSLKPFIANKEFSQLEGSTSLIFLQCLFWYGVREKHREKVHSVGYGNYPSLFQIHTHSGWTSR